MTLLIDDRGETLVDLSNASNEFQIRVVGKNLVPVVVGIKALVLDTRKSAGHLANEQALLVSGTARLPHAFEILLLVLQAARELGANLGELAPSTIHEQLLDAALESRDPDLVSRELRPR